MSAAELLVELDRQGFTLAAEGDRIRVAPASRLTAELRDRIGQHKAELLTALDLKHSHAAIDAPAELYPWDLPPDLYELWQERAGIMFFDGRVPWPQVEVLALADVLRQADPNPATEVDRKV